MADSCSTKTIMVTVQENGIIRHPITGIFMGRLENDITFESLSELEVKPATQDSVPKKYNNFIQEP
jgi:hypothetical protein